MKRAVITGASGLLGGNLAIALCNAGYSVAATRRGSTKTAHLDAFDIDWVDASLADRDALTRVFDGVDVVFHCAAAVSVQYKVEPWIHEANVVGTDNVIAAVREVGARLVHCSSVVAIGMSPDGQPSTEELQWNLPEYGLDDAYSKTKYESQQNVLAAARNGLDAVVVNPSFMIGPYDARPSSGKLVAELMRGRVPAYSLGRNNFVDVRDVARGMIGAATRGRANELYILGGHDLSYREFFERVAAVTGAAMPRFAAPRWATALLGHIGDLHAAVTGAEPAMNSATMRWGNAPHYVFSSAKAERELGYTISPIEPAIADCADWFRAHGMV